MVKTHRPEPILQVAMAGVPMATTTGVPGVPGDAALDGCAGAKGRTTKLRAGTYKERGLRLVLPLEGIYLHLKLWRSDKEKGGSERDLKKLPGRTLR